MESISARTLSALAAYHWPGNIRELENVIERAVILSSGPELEVSLPAAVSSQSVVITSERTNQNMNFDDAERAHILRALSDTNWIVGGPRGAASKLGLNRWQLVKEAAAI
jgi:formate hydrogenlyase transcriptional activator